MTNIRDRFMEYLRNEAGLSPATIAAYRHDLRGLDGDLTQETVHSWLSRSKDSDSAYRRKVAALRSFLRQDLSETVETPHVWHKLPVVASKAQVERMLHEAAVSSRRDSAILEVLYGCGLRASELCGLQAGDVNFEAGYLHCRGKGGKERLVPVNLTALGALARYRAERPPTGPLFVSRTGKSLRREDIFRIVKRYAARPDFHRFIRTRSDIRLRHIYWLAGRTFDPFRKCWVMRRLSRPGPRHSRKDGDVMDKTGGLVVKIKDELED